MKSKQTTIILSIFGLHYFYLGKVGLGILYWLTCWGYGIWWVIDILRFACMSKEEFDIKYNTPYHYFAPTPTPTQNTNTNIVNVGTQDNANQLKVYNELHEKGILTDEEFEIKKKQLLGV